MDFAPPVGYTEPTRKQEDETKTMVDPAELMDQQCGFFAFKGKGNR